MRNKAQYYRLMHYFSISFNILKFFSLCLIIYIPISGIPYFLDSISGDSTRFVRRMGMNSNLKLTVLRDLLFFISLGICFTKAIIGKFKFSSLNYFYLSFLMFLIYIFGSFVYAFFNFPLAISLSGFRLVQCFLITWMFFYIAKKNSDYILDYFKIFSIIFWIELCACIVQTRMMISYEGQTFFGSRVIGTFNNPNTIGAFFAFSLMIFIFFKKNSNITGSIYAILSIFGVLLAGSRTSIILVFFLIAFFLWSHTKKFLLKFSIIFISPLVLIALCSILPHLAGRGNAISLTQDPRWNILYNTFSSVSLSQFIFGYGFGYGSNTLNSLVNSFSNYFYVDKSLMTLTDSTTVIIFLQFGIIGSLLYFLLLVSIAFFLRTRGVVICGYIAILGVSNVWFEMYPINLLICSLLGMHLATRFQFKE